jgi:RNA polymerase sigma-70 factor (sigma-E family)
VDARRGLLVRTAYLLCGDWHRAEDLVQQALTKLYVAWPRVAGGGGEDAYARQVLLNAARDDWRRSRRRPEVPTERHDDLAAPEDPHEDRDALRAALARLSPGQRQVVVLRYWLDLSVDDTARDLGITTGTVKSQAARALGRLREALGDDFAATRGGAR